MHLHPSNPTLAIRRTHSHTRATHWRPQARAPDYSKLHNRYMTVTQPLLNSYTTVKQSARLHTHRSLTAALTYGLPPTGGWGMGLDRCTSQFTGLLGLLGLLRLLGLLDYQPTPPQQSRQSSTNHNTNYNIHNNHVIMKAVSSTHGPFAHPGPCEPSSFSSFFFFSLTPIWFFYLMIMTRWR